MLARSVTSRVPIPHEEGEWIEFRRLSWTQLGQARLARHEASRELLDAQPAELRASIQQAGAQQPVMLDALIEYDLATLLELGIAGWSYDAPVTTENLADLDAETAEWAARQIVKPTRRTEEGRSTRLFRIASSVRRGAWLRPAGGMADLPYL